MKRKLLEWRTLKCNTCFGAESPPRSTRLKTTRFHAAPYGTVSANLRKVGTLFRRGTVFAPIQSTYGREATGMENPKMRSLFWFRKRPPRSTRLQTIRFHAAPSWTVSANLRKVGASFRLGTVFEPIQSTYEKEATGMESSKMQSLFWCRKHLAVRASKLPGFMQRRMGPSVQIAESRGFLSPRYRVCTNPIYI